MEVTDHIKNMIEAAWLTERDMRLLGVLPPHNAALAAKLIPPDGAWECRYLPRAACRSIVLGDNEIAIVNPQGTMLDELEGEVAMGLTAAPIMDKALRVIFALASNDSQTARVLIQQIARAAITTAELPAPNREVGQE